MNTFKLAFQNFKRSVSTYLSLILSLAFTITAVVNFQNLIYSDTFASLQGHNRDYIDIVVNCVTMALLCFMFFFIWYATDVFLGRRKKEIGIYVFMGLTNQRIGWMYMVETTLIGLTALGLGLGIGALVSQLFQMILLAMSDLSVELRFRFSIKNIWYTCIFYGGIYSIFAAKGYFNIVRSSVLGLVSANRREESVRQNGFILACKAVLGLAVLGSGFYMATKDGRLEVFTNLLKAVALVIAGVYLLFGGFIPLVFQSLVKNKRLLYRKGRVLWMNQMVFRIRKNYRTYAMTCVLMLCSVTALAAGFAMKLRYEKILQFRSIYSFQFVAPETGLGGKIGELIERENDIVCSPELAMLWLDDSLYASQTFFGNPMRPLLCYSEVVRAAQETGLKEPVREPAEDEFIMVTRAPLLSFITDRRGWTVEINGKVYNEIEISYEPYMGYLQEDMSFYVVNDAVYRELLPLGEELHVYNYGIADPRNYAASLDDTDFMTESERMGRVAIDPNDEEYDWCRALYPICVFLFLVFILASGSILFMKLYNDAFEDRERYQILQKLGCGDRILRYSIAKELLAAYAMPFLVMAVSAWFSVHTLEKLMSEKLVSVYMASVVIVFLFFAVFYGMSVVLYCRNAVDRGGYSLGRL